MAKVSIILTVYNGAKYLNKCMDSILNQTLNDVEIICVDDASTDDTPLILDEYLKDTQIKIIRNAKNYGAGASRNIGMKCATGEYLSFLDADDIFESTMLEKAYKKAIKYDADICVFKEDIFGEDESVRRGYAYAHGLMKELEERGCFSPQEIKTQIFNIWNGWAWDKIFRRDFVEKEKLQFQEIRTSNDGFFVHAALVTAKSLVFVDEILVHHRTNVAGSLSASRNKSWECCYEYLLKLREYLIEKNLYKIYEQSFINWLGYFFQWNYQTLSEENRQSMYDAFKSHILEDFQVGCYKRDIFYDKYKFYFLQQLLLSNTYDECVIPLTELDRFTCVYQENLDKIDLVMKYFSDSINGVGIWGAGERAKAFLNACGKKIDITYVFDNEPLKECDYGKICILVVNSAYIPEIVESVRKASLETIVFDLDSYLCQNVSIESCIM